MQNADRQSSNKPCRAFPTRWMRTRIFHPLLLLLVALAGVAANCFNAEGRPVWCAPGEYTLGMLPFVALALPVVLSWWQGWRFTAFLLFTWLLAFVATEGLLRLYAVRFAPPAFQRLALLPEHWEHLPQCRYTPHHYALYTPTPNLRTPTGTVHNSLGLRDHREFSAQHPESVRIVFIGGSTTYTVGIEDNRKIFSYRLEERLNAYYRDRLQGRRIEVINAGVGGATSAENLIRMIFFVSELQPDLVVIQHGLNDVYPRCWGSLRSDYGNYRRPWSEPGWQLSAHHSLAVSATLAVVRHSVLLHTLGTACGLTSPTTLRLFVVREDLCDERPVEEKLRANPPDYFVRNTKYMIALARAMGAKVVLVTAPIAPRASLARQLAMPEHNRLLRQIAAAERVRLFDLDAAMTKDDEHMPDGIHVSQAGSDLKCELLFHYFVGEELVPELLSGCPELVADSPPTPPPG